MIGRIQGMLITKSPPLLLIDVNGVGYEVFVPMSTYYQLPEIGKKIELLTHFYCREDVQVLYGFYEEKERALFRSLIKISGVGPKMALTILSGMDVTTFLQCIEYRDSAILTRLPGVGKKTAERLIIEMAGKFQNKSKEPLAALSEFLSGENQDPALKNRLSLAFEDAQNALISLGYKREEAIKAIKKVMDEDNEESGENTGNGENDKKPNTAKPLEAQDIIRRALQSFAKVKS